MHFSISCNLTDVQPREFQVGIRELPFLKLNFWIAEFYQFFPHFDQEIQEYKILYFLVCPETEQINYFKLSFCTIKRLGGLMRFSIISCNQIAVQLRESHVRIRELPDLKLNFRISDLYQSSQPFSKGAEVGWTNKNTKYYTF